MSRLLGLQEAAQDKVAERQAVAARRQADEVERLWRRKEETKAAKDVITIKALTKGRDEQLAFKSKFVDAQVIRYDDCILHHPLMFAIRLDGA